MSQYLDKDGASRIAENFLLKQSEQDAILENLQFDLKEAEHALVKTIQGPAPLNIRALSRPLDDYLISGNTVQDGTPTPEAPVDVQGCGVRTAQLFEDKIASCSIDAGGRLIGNPDFDMYLAKVEQGETYIASANITGGFFATKPVIGSTSYNGRRMTYASQTITAPITGYMTFRVNSGGAAPMFNLGSTAMPYEPYGYKLPLTVNGTEYPIYLGQVPTTRKIKKYIFTGEENGTIYSTRTGRNGIGITGIPGVIGGNAEIAILAICTHYQPDARNDLYRNTDNGISNAYQNDNIIFFDASCQTVEAFQQFCTQQYAAGTPVTIWYVLAEPETAVVNEPLHKIGDYADTISMTQAGVEISTTRGFNTITTDTIVLPSNIEVKGVINNA